MRLRSFQLVRYYGWYSNRMRGDRKRQHDLAEEDSEQQSPVSEVINMKGYGPKGIPKLMWRECTPRALEVYASLFQGA